MTTQHKIKEKGIKLTPQRKAIYEALKKLCHASIDEIITEVHKKNPEFTVSTIYRVLDTFVEISLISKFSSPSGKTFFDITPTMHHHFFNPENKIMDYSDEELTEMIKERILLKTPTLTEVKQVVIQIVAV